MRLIIVAQCHLKCPTMAAQVELIFRFFDFSIFKLCGRQALKLDTRERERERGLFALRRLRVSLRQSSGLQRFGFLALAARWHWANATSGDMGAASAPPLSSPYLPASLYSCYSPQSTPWPTATLGRLLRLVLLCQAV